MSENAVNQINLREKVPQKIVVKVINKLDRQNVYTKLRRGNNSRKFVFIV